MKVHQLMQPGCRRGCLLDACHMLDSLQHADVGHQACHAWADNWLQCMLPPQIASEILWTMVGRDVDVRRSLAMHGGLADLLRLTHSSNGDVGAVAVMCLAAYARDVSTSAAPTSPPPGAQGQPDPSSTAEQPGGAGADTSSAIKRDSVSGSVQGSTLGGGSTAHPGAGATSTSSTPLPSAPAPPPPERKIGGGASLLLDSGESLGVVQELMGLMGDLLGLYSSGVDLLGSGGHSLLEVMEVSHRAGQGCTSLSPPVAEAALILGAPSHSTASHLLSYSDKSPRS
jgi:hypothetical protein